MGRIRDKVSGVWSGRMHWLWLHYLCHGEGHAGESTGYGDGGTGSQGSRYRGNRLSRGDLVDI
uniref:Uncharacterized protein n=1 Tax=Oryza brachyantha TaxID=4533 RepID=J3M6Y3_ORYBR